MTAVVARNLGELWLPLFAAQEEQLGAVVTRFVDSRQGNSVLLIGPSGSGKSELVRRVLRRTLDSRDESVTTLQLNGLMQTDDRMALRSIADQLGREVVPSETPANVMGALPRLFAAGWPTRNVQSAAVARVDGHYVFVLEAFDELAGRAGQSLLYTLLDATHSAAVLVVGVSSRVDVVELLEKRVRSRLSLAHVQLLNDWQLDAYVDASRQCLRLADASAFARRFNEQTRNVFDAEAVQSVLGEQYRRDKSMRSLKQLLALVLAGCDDDCVSERAFVDAAKFLRLLPMPSPSATLLEGISLLDLCLLIAIKHVSESSEGQPFNFNSIFQELTRFANRSYKSVAFDRAVVAKAFERLEALELIAPVSRTAARSMQRAFQLHELQVDAEEIESLVDRYQPCPAAVRHWLTHRVHF